jgi:hypothetical protein
MCCHLQLGRSGSLGQPGFGIEQYFMPLCAYFVRVYNNISDSIEYYEITKLHVP